MQAPDFDYAVFHQPNVKFPSRAAQRLGFKTEQIQDGLLSNWIGNTYAGASLTGFSAVLDVARPGTTVLLVSFGSGAGSDAFAWRVTEPILARQGLAPKVREYIDHRVEIDYALYARYRGKLKTS